MKFAEIFLRLCCVSLMAVFADAAAALSNAPAARSKNYSTVAAQETAKLVYADFETSKDNRPVSNGGGVVQLISYEERPTLKSRYTRRYSTG